MYVAAYIGDFIENGCACNQQPAFSLRSASLAREASLRILILFSVGSR